ncbi:GNAT family N-acetyltransferase [Nocardioides panacisoli]|uniref:BioF2-like acetyltransferase domain-containing protein n=1 Tax=Nocardioides panacisoli TaxID=627624 RepID=A0ABP7IQU9_9ACTN
MTADLLSTVATGDAARAELGRLVTYVDRHSVAFCTSSWWLEAAARLLPAEPVVITVRAGPAPVAVAALGVTKKRGARRISLLGGELNDYGQLFHDDEPAAVALGEAIAAWTAEQGRWSLDLDQLPPGDPVAGVLVDRLGASLGEGPPMPQIAGLGTDYRISRNRVRNAQKAINRVEADGRTWARLTIEDAEVVDRWLPRVVELRRGRDHGVGRRSHLDDPAARSFYTAVVREAVARGRAAMNLFLVDDDLLAGYSVVMFDGATHRFFDCRVADDHQRYRGGSVCELMAVTRARDAEDVTGFDWLRGRTEAKFGNDELFRVRVTASSHRSVVAIDEWEQATRQRVKAVLPAAAVRRLVAR